MATLCFRTFAGIWIAFACLVYTSPLIAESTAQRPGTVFKDCPDCPEMVVIPPGTFQMGDLNGLGLDNEQPVHAVTIASPFAVGKYEVTLDEYDQYIKESGAPEPKGCIVHDGTAWVLDDKKNWRQPSFPQTPRDPVVCVDWNDVQAYTKWLSAKTGQHYRLLSETEWEYAARAGTKTTYSWGDEFGTNNANCGPCDNHWKLPVGSFHPNAFGLYDMHGNAAEWVEDCYSENYAQAPTDGSVRQPKDSGPCTVRVIRGGSWTRDNAAKMRAAYRTREPPLLRHFSIGFRLARELEPQ